MRDFHLPGRSPVYSTHGMAATAMPAATLTALDVLRAGGNAMDAAIAAVAVLGVIEPQSTGIGGDCFCLYAPNGSDKVEALNGSGRAPAAATIDWFEQRGIAQLENTSPHTVTIPGAVSAWETLLDRHGTKGLDELLAPAIRFADEGWPVHARVAFDWNLLEGKLRKNGAEAFLPNGAAPAPATSSSRNNWPQPSAPLHGTAAAASTRARSRPTWSPPCAPWRPADRGRLRRGPHGGGVRGPDPHRLPRLRSVAVPAQRVRPARSSCCSASSRGFDPVAGRAASIPCACTAISRRRDWSTATATPSWRTPRMADVPVAHLTSARIPRRPPRPYPGRPGDGAHAGAGRGADAGAQGHHLPLRRRPRRQRVQRSSTRCSRASAPASSRPIAASCCRTAASASVVERGHPNCIARQQAPHAHDHPRHGDEGRPGGHALRRHGRPLPADGADLVPIANMMDYGMDIQEALDLPRRVSVSGQAGGRAGGAGGRRDPARSPPWATTSPRWTAPTAAARRSGWMRSPRRAGGGFGTAEGWAWRWGTEAPLIRCRTPAGLHSQESGGNRSLRSRFFNAFCEAERVVISVVPFTPTPARYGTRFSKAILCPRRAASRTLAAYRLHPALQA